MQSPPLLDFTVCTKYFQWVVVYFNKLIQWWVILAGRCREGFLCAHDHDSVNDVDNSEVAVAKRTVSWISWGLVECCVSVLTVCVVFVSEKSRALSPHSEAKKQALGPDDLRTSSLGRPVLSPYPMSPRDMAKISHDQHLLHFNCESSTLFCPCY